MIICFSSCIFKQSLEVLSFLKQHGTVIRMETVVHTSTWIVNVLDKTLVISYTYCSITVVIVFHFIILQEKDMLSILNSQICFWPIFQHCVGNLIIWSSLQVLWEQFIQGWEKFSFKTWCASPSFSKFELHQHLSWVINLCKESSYGEYVLIFTLLLQLCVCCIIYVYLR